MATSSFPDQFVWGAATSAYQIEGATDFGGRGESIWDRFVRRAGAVEDGSDGVIACDHYQRWPEDVALMQQLGIRSYRFSIAWPRIQPTGRGMPIMRGLDFYSRLVDSLLEHGIEPVVTLYHWDLPQALEDAGGWPVRATAEAFVEYAHIVTQHLGDRVRRWITHNEPWCAAFLGYQTGRHAPGRRDWPAALAASHHLLLSHGLVVPVIRSNSPTAEVGITLNFTPAVPASPSIADADACRHFDGYFNRWFIAPLYGRGYPADMVADYQALGYLPTGAMPFVQDGDLATIAVPTDFLGVNYYTREVVRSQLVLEQQNLPPTVVPQEEWTDMGWEVSPDSFYDLLCRLYFEYHPPKLFVTENGASYSDGPSAKGQVRDTRRLHYIRDHLAAVQRAIAAGVPMAGYYVWSLLDNFEWDRGYTQRFGIVWVDYETQQRLPKESAHWYSRVIAANALVPVTAE